MWEKIAIGRYIIVILLMPLKTYRKLRKFDNKAFEDF